MNKPQGPGYGELPAKNITANPWDEVAVDLIGPWNITRNDRTYTFEALTCIDPLTTLCEIIPIEARSSAHISMKFDTEWLTRYPRPLRCIHDQGGEFTGPEFQLLLQLYGIQDVPTTVKNPQANAVNERLHQTVQSCIRTFMQSQEANYVNPDMIVQYAIASTRYAVRSAINRALNNSPGSIVFQRDMLLPIPVLANIQALQQRRQLKVNQELFRQNQRRRYKDYQVGDQVKIVQEGIKRKLDPNATGPYVITEVHTNGTVVIQRHPHVFERINIRRIRPYQV
jgi:hypothetical protein